MPLFTEERHFYYSFHHGIRCCLTTNGIKILIAQGDTLCLEVIASYINRDNSKAYRKNDRLFEHLNLGLEFPLQREFAEYVLWVASFFSHQIAYDRSDKTLTLFNSYKEKDYGIVTEKNEVYYSRSVVVAPGQTLRISTAFENASPYRVFHLTRYLKSLKQLNENNLLNRITVIGGSQSAIEMILYLRQNYPNSMVRLFQLRRNGELRS